MSFKNNVVGDLKFWKYFRTRFAGTHPPRLLVSPDSHWLQRHKILVILMGHKKMQKFGMCVRFGNEKRQHGGLEVKEAW